MKAPAMAAGIAALLAGCGGAPDSLDLSEFEDADRSFMAARADVRGVADSILKQERLTLEDALRIADHLNPDLASERRNVDLATAAMWEASLRPNPSVFLELEDFRTRGGSMGNSERTAGISMPLPVTGRIGAATSLADKEREIAALKYVARRREILSEVKKVFVAHLAARRTVELARETLTLAKAQHATAEERYKAEAVPEMELLKSAVQVAKAESGVRKAERELASSVRALNARMGNADLPKEQFDGAMAESYKAPSLDALRGPVLSLHPLMRIAEKTREAARLQLDLARAQRFSDAGLEFAAGRNPEDETILEAGVSIPLPLFDRSQARISHAEIRIQQAELQTQNVRNGLIVALTEAYGAFTAAQDLATLYRVEILPKARKALDQTMEGYGAGRFGMLEVLDSQRTLAEARSAHAAALADMNLAAVELERLTGSRLEPLR